MAPFLFNSRPVKFVYKEKLLYNSVMPSVPYITQKRRTRQAAHRTISRAGTGCAFMTGLLIIFFVFTSAYLYFRVTAQLPSVETLPALFEPPDGLLLQPTQIYDRSNGHLLLTLQNPAATESQYLRIDPAVTKDNPISLQPAGNSLPGSLLLATIASIDPTFWENPGFTWDLRSGNGSTFAERLVSEFLLDREAPGLFRILRMKLLAAQLTSQYGKSKVLEWYLNDVRYGNLLYGASAAARAYFHKPANELNLAEAAALAALAETPMENPANNPKKVIERQRSILQELLNGGWVPSLQVKDAVQEAVYFYPAAAQPESLAPAFTNLVLQQLERSISREKLERGGYIIQTSLDYDLQLQVQCAAREQLRRIGNLESTEQSGCQAARLLPTLPNSGMRAGANETAEVVIQEATTGQVLAFSTQSATGENPVLGAHEPGALLTPIIDLTAFTRGLSPATLAWDIPASLPPDLQSNIQENEYHGPVRLRTALANGYLATALQLLFQLSPETVARTAQQLELESIDSAVLEGMLHKSPFLSGGETTALQIGQAYSVFATLGNLSGQSGGESTQTLPAIIQSVRTGDGSVLFTCNEQAIHCTRQTKPVVSSGLAYLVTNMLSDEAARWPSLGHPNSLEIGRPAGALIARSGTEGAWTVGFTPQLVVSVWTGAGQASQDESGGTVDATPASAALWHAIIQYASQGKPPTGWTAPQDIVSMPVCDPSGMLPTSDCPTVVNEVFTMGNEPRYPDSLYRSFSINRETGRLATVFTPPGLVEEKVFLKTPPEAESWAQQAGLPQPPSDYDVVAASLPASPQVQIEVPTMFSSVKQKIILTGTASGKDFQFYRLQAGQGLYPQKWIQIGKDSTTPVNNGILGEWDTSGYSGLYALQLQVVRKDQRIETMTIQVTVDNQPPEVESLRPLDGQSYPAKNANAIVLEAKAADNIGIAKVEYYIDRQLIASLSNAPFTFSWSGAAGQHRLTVRAYDLAGNQSEQSIQFSIQAK